VCSSDPLIISIIYASLRGASYLSCVTPSFVLSQLNPNTVLHLGHRVNTYTKVSDVVYAVECYSILLPVFICCWTFFLVLICADVFPDEKRENDCLANLLGSRIAWVVCKKLLTEFAEASIYRLKQSRFFATSTHFWGFNKSDVKRLAYLYWKKVWLS